MSEKTSNKSENKTAKRPSHIAYQVREVKDQKFWDRVGVAWQHEDGKGLSLQLQAVPLDGRIVVRLAEKES